MVREDGLAFGLTSKGRLQNKEKFAEEHPNQAEKVHLKHVAESQNELREEYKREREEALEALAETNRARNAIVVILVIIVLITISFEKLAHHIKHHVSEFVSPVVEMLFKELTVLGFIALLVFMSIKTGEQTQAHKPSQGREIQSPGRIFGAQTPNFHTLNLILVCRPAPGALHHDLRYALGAR